MDNFKPPNFLFIIGDPNIFIVFARTESTVSSQTLELAASEFQRRFHISADDNEPNRRASITSNASQVTTLITK